MNSIIHKPNKKYYYNKNNNYYKGYITPINRKYTTGMLNINSIFRQNYSTTSSTNFLFTLPIIMKNILSIKLTDIYIPNTYYTIHSSYNNNFFLIKTDIDNNTKKIIIPNGNYTSNDIVDFLNHTMQELGDLFQYIYFGINQKQPNTSGELIVGVVQSAPFNFSFTLDFLRDLLENNNILHTPLQYRFGWLLGFRYDIYRNNSTYISEAAINITKPEYFFLAIDYFNYYNYYSFITKINNSHSSNIIAKILLSDSKQTIINTPQLFFGPISLEKLFISLIDEHGRIVNLNGADFNFIISFDKAFNI